MSNIPGDEDFARAKRLDKERYRNIDKVCRSITRHFKRICPLHSVYMFVEGVARFRACVFFNTDKDIEACKSNGIVEQLIDFVYVELERVGRGKREDITVEFEFDSDENVNKNFEGDYYCRLH